MLRYLICGFACIFLGTTLLAQSSNKLPEELTPDQKKFIALCNEMSKATEAFYAGMHDFKDFAEAEKYLNEKDPIIKFGPLLEAMEQEHRGTHLGLMIACKLSQPGKSLMNSPNDPFRQRMLSLLSDYASFEELPEILRLFEAGKPEPGVEPCLRAIIASPAATEQNRLFAKFMLAKWAISMNKMRAGVERQVRELKEGAGPQSPIEEKIHNQTLAAIPSQETLDRLKAEAYENLKSLSQSKTPGWQPVVKWVDEGALISHVDHESTKAQPRISELAAGVLFQEEHLLPGRAAPALELELVNDETGDKADDKKWSLADQKGKCVIIQFSFKGCGPCERMYPDLQNLAKQFPEKLSVVSIMADRDREDTVEAVKTGKVTWGAHFDGRRGPICTKWAVVGFPTVFVLDPEGKMAAIDWAESEKFKAQVAKLCK